MTTDVTIIPDKGVYRPGETPVIEIRGLHDGGELSVTHFADIVSRIAVQPGCSRVELESLPEGGYGLDFASARTALDVVDNPFRRPRYAFLSELADGERTPEIVQFMRRIHATHVQFYDWAYRHDELLAPEQHYTDPLGLERSLDVIRERARQLKKVGASALGYVAIYAIPAAAEARWTASLMYRQDGTPFRLGENFLSLTDPSDAAWRAHFYAELRRAVDGTGLHGFHLDSYGWPKIALRHDGTIIDLADAFSSLVDGVRDAVPEAEYMFNNVNDFPTEWTTRTRQDATYIEVWPPHETYADLAGLIARARAGEPSRPPILAAYLSRFSEGDPEESMQSARLLMATAFSNGGSVLLLGEDGRLLTGPYYAHHHTLVPAHVEEFVAWHDFAVRYGELLHAADAIDVSERFAGGINHDIDVILDDGSRASTKPTPGTLWLRVVRSVEGLVIHLIDLTGQDEVAWDGPKSRHCPTRGARLVVGGVNARTRVLASSPSSPSMRSLGATATVSFDQTDALSAAESGVVFELPPIDTWSLLLIPWSSWGRAGAEGSSPDQE